MVCSNLRNRIFEATLMRPRSFLLFIPILLAFTGCSRGPWYTNNPQEKIYVSGPPAMLLLSHEHQAELGASAELSLTSFHGAYAITDHIGAIASGGFESNTQGAGSYNRRFNAELGGGYFLRLGEQGRFEIYGGYGFGNASTASQGYPNTGGGGGFIFAAEGPTQSIFERDSTTSATNSHFFFQANIGIEGENVGVGFGVKASTLSFRNLTYGESDLYKTFDTLSQGFHDYRVANFTSESATSFLIETSFIFQFGSPSFKVYIETWGTNVLNPKLATRVQLFNFAGGLKYRF